jgi:nicotinate phosphoribosyltransferase
VTRRGTAVTELITTEGPAAEGRGRPLLRRLGRGGEITGFEPLTAARDRHRAVLAELPPHALSLARGYPALPTVFEPDQPDVPNGES